MSAAILSAQDMVISVLPQAYVDAHTHLAGREEFVTYQDVLACLDLTAVAEVCSFNNCSSCFFYNFYSPYNLKLFHSRCYSWKNHNI